MTKRQRLEKRYLKNLTLEIEKYLRKFLHSKETILRKQTREASESIDRIRESSKTPGWSGARDPKMAGCWREIVTNPSIAVKSFSSEDATGGPDGRKTSYRSGLLHSTLLWSTDNLVFFPGFEARSTYSEQDLDGLRLLL